ncbi:MAG: hypothetical protein WBE72_11955 [Terracidiphilus sp.]
MKTFPKFALCWAALACALFAAGDAARAAAQSSNPLLRKYRNGETLIYKMNGINESRHYTIQADGIVKKDPDGAYFEEYRWTDLVSAGQPTPLSAASQAFRQRLSLDPNSTLAPPDLSKVDPGLIGPITDFMTFYSDLWLAVKTGQLAKPGDHFYFPYGAPASWADGSRVLVGESSIDFDLTLKSVDPATQTAMLVVRHVPPQKPQVHLSATWMQAPVADTPNNWVLISKSPDGKFDAAAGQETLTVELHVSLADGKILSAGMDNTVKTVGRTCDDQALTKCSPPQPHVIVRKIDISLVQ